MPFYAAIDGFGYFLTDYDVFELALIRNVYLIRVTSGIYVVNNYTLIVFNFLRG